MSLPLGIQGLPWGVMTTTNQATSPEINIDAKSADYSAEAHLVAGVIATAINKAVSVLHASDDPGKHVLSYWKNDKTLTGQTRLCEELLCEQAQAFIALEANRAEWRICTGSVQQYVKYSVRKTSKGFSIEAWAWCNYQYVNVAAVAQI